MNECEGHGSVYCFRCGATLTAIEERVAELEAERDEYLRALSDSEESAAAACTRVAALEAALRCIRDAAGDATSDHECVAFTGETVHRCCAALKGGG
jgi:hypothetical protein